MTEPIIAVWYRHYSDPHYQLCATERGAAAFSADLENRLEGIVIGVQYADGRKLASDEWDDVIERYRQEAYEELRRQSPKPKPATRTVQVPFAGWGETEVLATAPQWLGET